MNFSKVFAFLATVLIGFGAIHQFVLLPEGINIFSGFVMPKFEFKTAKASTTKKSERGSNTKPALSYRSSHSKSSGFSPYVADELHGVLVYNNGKETNVFGRNTTRDGYNLGLKYQCVEFVKRYYYERYNHKMPNSYGHAKEFYNYGLSDGAYNNDRALYQFSNPSKRQPKTGDIIIWGPTPQNSYGHIAIISEVSNEHIQVVQQNGGANNPTRINIPLGQTANSRWQIFGKHIVGVLGKT